MWLSLYAGKAGISSLSNKIQMKEKIMFAKRPYWAVGD